MQASMPLAYPMAGNDFRASEQVLQRIAPFILVVLLHVGLFFAMSKGLLQEAKQITPREIIATLIAPQIQQAPKTETPPLPTPKPHQPVVTPIPKVEKSPPKQIIEPKPSEHAISTPKPAPSAPVEPAAATAPATPAPAATAPTSTAPAVPKTITSGVEYIQKPSPEYPPLSRRMGEEGTVTLRILVNEKGRAERVDIQRSSGFPRLDEAARQAALRAVFKPYMENGRPLPFYVPAPITFQLDN